MKRLSQLKAEVVRWPTAQSQLNDALELASLGDPSLAGYLADEAQRLTRLVNRVICEALMDGPYDHRDAILTIHVRADMRAAQDWAALLLRMYLHFAEQHGLQADIFEYIEGQVGQIKRVTVMVKGHYAYGYLQSEDGVHHLVQMNPSNTVKHRISVPVLVEVIPTVKCAIDEKDLEIDIYRSIYSSCGGPRMGKPHIVASIVHKPSGLVVAYNNEGNQRENHICAMQVLQARLFDLNRRPPEQRIAHTAINSAAPIRSYKLSPRPTVTDHRTGCEIDNIQTVLDGALDEFMKAYLHGIPDRGSSATRKV